MFVPSNTPTVREMSQGFAMLLYGEPKVGKTHFAATFPNPLILSTDGNFKGVTTPAVLISPSMTMTVGNGITTNYSGWEVIKAIVNDTAAIKANKYETIIIDIASHVYTLCRQHHLARLGVADEADVPYGKGFTPIREDFIWFLNTCKQNFKYVVLIAHQKDKAGIKSALPKIRPDIGNSVLTILESFTDFTTYCEKAYAGDGKLAYSIYLNSAEPASGYRDGWYIDMTNLTKIPADFNLLRKLLDLNTAEKNKLFNKIQQGEKNE